MIIVHVDDMLLATNNSHQAVSHLSRLLSKHDIKDVKRTDDDGGVLHCGKRVRTVLGVSATRPDRVCESSLRTCQYASSPSPTRGSPVYNKRNSREATYDTEFALGNGRNTSGRVVRDQSVAEETISAPTSAPSKLSNAGGASRKLV